MVIGAQEPIELDAEVRQGEVISQNVKQYHSTDETRL
jgi:hypothetical protein